MKNLRYSMVLGNRCLVLSFVTPILKVTIPLVLICILVYGPLYEISFFLTWLFLISTWSISMKWLFDPVLFYWSVFYQITFIYVGILTSNWLRSQLLQIIYLPNTSWNGDFCCCCMECRTDRKSFYHYDSLPCVIPIYITFVQFKGTY